MKLLIEIEELIESFGRDCRTPLVQNGLDALDDLLVVPACRQPCVLALEESPEFDGFARFLLGHLRDRRAAPRRDFDQPLGGKCTDRLAHGIAGHPQFVRKAALDQTVAWLQSPGQYGLTKLTNHLVAKWRMLLAK